MLFCRERGLEGGVGTPLPPLPPPPAMLTPLDTLVFMLNGA